MSKMQSLARELDEMLKEDGKVVGLGFVFVSCTLKGSFASPLSLSIAGLGCLTSVIGFYCRKCEEFIGDFNSAENHAAIHRHSNSIVSTHCTELTVGEAVLYYCERCYTVTM